MSKLAEQMMGEYWSKTIKKMVELGPGWTMSMQTHAFDDSHVCISCTLMDDGQERDAIREVCDPFTLAPSMLRIVEMQLLKKVAREKLNG